MKRLLKIPRLNEDIELIKDDGKYFLCHRFSSKVLLLLNEVAIDIVNRIDGENSISNIIEKLMDKYQVSSEELENDVQDLLSVLQIEEFLC